VAAFIVQEQVLTLTFSCYQHYIGAATPLGVSLGSPKMYWMDVN